VQTTQTAGQHRLESRGHRTGDFRVLFSPRGRAKGEDDGARVWSCPDPGNPAFRLEKTAPETHSDPGGSEIPGEGLLPGQGGAAVGAPGTAWAEGVLLHPRRPDARNRIRLRPEEDAPADPAREREAGTLGAVWAMESGGAEPVGRGHRQPRQELGQAALG